MNSLATSLSTYGHASRSRQTHLKLAKKARVLIPTNENRNDIVEKGDITLVKNNHRKKLVMGSENLLTTAFSNKN